MNKTLLLAFFLIVCFACLSFASVCKTLAMKNVGLDKAGALEKKSFAGDVFQPDPNDQDNQDEDIQPSPTPTPTPEDDQNLSDDQDQDEN